MDWTAVLIHLITALPPALVALAALVAALRGSAKVDAMHKAMDCGLADVTAASAAHTRPAERAAGRDAPDRKGD